jgi:hypothetical protein
MKEKWVLLYSARQDAYHVETEQEFQQKGPGQGGYRILGKFDSQDAALKRGRELRKRRAA